MRICTISDTHTQHEDIRIPENIDLIIHAGDVASRGGERECIEFLDWYGDLNIKHKVLVAGNHDFAFESNWDKLFKIAQDKGIHLLYDTSVTIEGLKIWGSPVQIEFCNWAFNRSRTIEDSMTEEAQRMGHSFIGNHWDKIPEDADIIITHGPAYGTLDRTVRGNMQVGCKLLARHIERIKPIMHVFGHIHEDRGIHIEYRETPTTYVNTSSLNLRYNPYLDDSFVFDLDKLKKGSSNGRD